MLRSWAVVADLLVVVGPEAEDNTAVAGSCPVVPEGADNNRGTNWLVDAAVEADNRGLRMEDSPRVDPAAAGNCC